MQVRSMKVRLFLCPRGDSWDAAHAGSSPPPVAQGEVLGERGEGS